MSDPHNTVTFTLAMTKTIHIQAEEASQQFLPYFDKVEESYLNYLAVYATQYYLQLYDYPTKIPQPSISDYINQALFQGITLQLPGYGAISCISLTTGEKNLEIPLHVEHSPIAYVVVEFDENLSNSTLLGFLPQTEQTTVSVDTLNPLSELPDYLAQFNTLGSAITQLNRWWQRSFNQEWAFISELTLPDTQRLNPAVGRRSIQQKNISEAALLDQERPEDGVVCQKKIQLGTKTFYLSLTIEKFSQSSEPNITILIRLSPQLGQAYLPANIQINAADEFDSIFSTIISREYSTSLELRFRAEPGDYFSLSLLVDDISLKEGFVV